MASLTRGPDNGPPDARSARSALLVTRTRDRGRFVTVDSSVATRVRRLRTVASMLAHLLLRVGAQRPFASANLLFWYALSHRVTGARWSIRALDSDHSVEKSLASAASRFSRVVPLSGNSKTRYLVVYF